jgi:hypothetical protein
MSLVILSNTSPNETELDLDGGIDRAYSFTNTLQTPIVIPKNSQVALQSLKINKDGTFQVARSNNLFYQYIGKKLTDTFTYDLSTRNVAYTRIYPEGEVDAEEFSGRVENAMNRAIYHPDYQGLATCSVQRNSSTSFDGYNLTYENRPSASGVNYRPTTDSSPGNQVDLVKATDDSTGWEYIAADHKFNKTSADGEERCFAQISHAPMSLHKAHFKVAFNGAAVWNIGLSRYCNPVAPYFDAEGNAEEKDFTYPDYFDTNDVGFYDFVARKEYNSVNGSYELKLYHAVWDTLSEDLSFKEVVYYGYTGATYTAPYDLTGNASAFTNIEFFIDGEMVEVYLEKDSNVDRTLVCSPELGTPGKNNYFKPINQSCAYLYGKWEIDGDADEHLILHNYDARNLTGFKYNGIDTTLSSKLPIQDRLINFDWWVTQLWLGKTYLPKIVDSRKFNIMLDAHIHTFVKSNASGYSNFTVVPVLSESEKYFQSRFANTEEILGFIGGSPLEKASSFNASSLTFTSSSTPKLIANQSVFVRLNGLTHRSINGATGNQSQIIYHCPRFDTSGNQTGGLFFETGEKTYIDINNPTDIQVNNLGIDFVDRKERFVKSIVGSSVVCLHIRPKM